MKNEVKLRDVMDSLDMAVLASKIEIRFGIDVFYESIPETFGDLRKRLVITRESPVFNYLWQKFVNKEDITCFTSGTTGTAKPVSHPWEFWLKHIRPGSSEAIWGLCYDPGHIAGIFVLLQAFATNARVVWLYDNYEEEIIENGVTHISASSTFYRMLNGVFPDVKRVTIGSMRPMEDLSVKFPNAKIRNIYATTEHGVIASSDNDWFDLKPGMSVKDGMLIVNGIETGDEVIVDGGRFFIRGRKGQFANIGGEKVYFEYVEDWILSNNPDVKNIRVYSKPNSVTGSVLWADVIGAVTDLSGLKKYETPIINTVDSIELVNGKVKRW